MDESKNIGASFSRLEQFTKDIEKMSPKKTARIYVIEKEGNKVEMGIDSLWRKVSRFFKGEKADVYSKETFSRYIISKKDSLFLISSLEKRSSAELIEKERFLTIYVEFMRVLGNQDEVDAIRGKITKEQYNNALIDHEGSFSDELKQNLKSEGHQANFKDLQTAISTIKLFDAIAKNPTEKSVYQALEKELKSIHGKLNDQSIELIQEAYLTDENIRKICVAKKTYAPAFFAGAILSKQDIDFETFQKNLKQADQAYNIIKKILPEKIMPGTVENSEIQFFRALGSEPKQVEALHSILQELETYNEWKGGKDIESLQNKLNAQKKQDSTQELAINFIQQSINHSVINKANLDDKLATSLKEHGAAIDATHLQKTIHAIHRMEKMFAGKQVDKELNKEDCQEFLKWAKENLQPDSINLLKNTYFSDSNLTLSHNYTLPFFAGFFARDPVRFEPTENMQQEWYEAKAFVTNVSAALEQKLTRPETISLYRILGKEPEKIAAFQSILQKALKNISKDEKVQASIEDFQIVFETMNRMNLLIAFTRGGVPLNQITKSSIEETQKKLDKASLSFLKQIYLSDDNLLQSKDGELTSFISGAFLNLSTIPLESVQNFKQNFETAKKFVDLFDKTIQEKTKNRNLDPENKLALFRALGSVPDQVDSLLAEFQTIIPQLTEKKEDYKDPSFLPERIKILEDFFINKLTILDQNDPNLLQIANKFENAVQIVNTQFTSECMGILPLGWSYPEDGPNADRITGSIVKNNLGFGLQPRHDGILAGAEWQQDPNNPDQLLYTLSACFDSETNRDNIKKYKQFDNPNDQLIGFPELHRISIPFSFAMITDSQKRSNALAAIKTAVDSTSRNKEEENLLKKPADFWNKQIRNGQKVKQSYERMALTKEQEQQFQQEVYFFAAEVLRETERLTWMLKGTDIPHVPFKPKKAPRF